MMTSPEHWPIQLFSEAVHLHTGHRQARPALPSLAQQARREPRLFSSPLAARKPVGPPAFPWSQSGRVGIPSSTNGRNVKSLKDSACPRCPSSRAPRKQAPCEPCPFGSPLAARKPLIPPAFPVTQSGRVGIPSSTNGQNVKSLKDSACPSCPSSRAPRKEPQDVLRTSRREEFTQIYRSHKTTNCNRNGTWNRSARLPRPSQLTTDGDLIAPFTVPVLSMKQPERSSPPFPSSN
ncbi:uncharacterized protein [Manis javanica]|uniref:uncharacterized protein n=1 Tax=Manis javanica TaxID=9974 RepID=UPI003C6D8100